MSEKAGASLAIFVAPAAQPEVTFPPGTKFCERCPGKKNKAVQGGRYCLECKRVVLVELRKKYPLTKQDPQPTEAFGRPVLERLADLGQGPVEDKYGEESGPYKVRDSTICGVVPISKEVSPLELSILHENGEFPDEDIVDD